MVEKFWVIGKVENKLWVICKVENKLWVICKVDTQLEIYKTKSCLFCVECVQILMEWFLGMYNSTEWNGQK